MHKQYNIGAHLKSIIICVSDKPKHVIESITSSPYITEKNTKPLPVSRADSHYTTGEDTVTDINMG